MFDLETSITGFGTTPFGITYGGTKSAGLGWRVGYSNISDSPWNGTYPHLKHTDRITDSSSLIYVGCAQGAQIYRVSWGKPGTSDNVSFAKVSTVSEDEMYGTISYDEWTEVFGN